MFLDGTKASFVCIAHISIKIIAIVLLLPSMAMAFIPLDEKAIRNAIGDLNGLPPVLQRAFTPNDRATGSLSTTNGDKRLTSSKRHNQTGRHKTSM